MIKDAKYVHTNLIARDWRNLASFYQAVLGCVPIPPERNYSGPGLVAGTGIPGASLEGIHLRLPGYEDAGPTLEIFSYSKLADGPVPAVNRPAWRISRLRFPLSRMPERKSFRTEGNPSEI